MSEQGARYQRSTGGMVGAMIVLVLVVVGFVVVRGLFSREPDRGVTPVDYQRLVPVARKGADFTLLAPPKMPPGWTATTVRFTDTVPQHWHLGALTEDSNYVGLEQGRTSTRDMVAQYVDAKAERHGTVQVAGEPWTTWTDPGGDLALVRRAGTTTTLVVGHHVARRDLVVYAASLR